MDTLTDYLDGYQYTNSILNFFPHPEGYVNVTYCQACLAQYQYRFNYVYQYKDHLGNIRLSYGYDEKYQVLKIIEENHYYPFGLKHTKYNSGKSKYEPDEEFPEKMKLKQLPVGESMVNKYKYNGKEYQDEMGLNMYDYGARNYDPALGRWMNIDPLAEKMRRWSPYNYCFDNPMRFTDPDGMGPDDWIEYTTSEGKQSVTYDPEVKTIEQAKTKGYTDVKQVVSSTKATNNVNGDKIVLNANGTYSVNGGSAINPAEQPYTEGGANINYNPTAMGQLGTALQGSGDALTITGIVVAAFCPPAGGALIAAGGAMATTGDAAELKDDYNAGNLNGEKVVTKAAMFGIPHGFSALGATTREEAAIEGLLIGLDNTVDEYRDNDYKGEYQKPLK